MELIPIIVVLVLLFGGGGGYWGSQARYLVKERVSLNCERGRRGHVYRSESTTQ